MYYQETRTELPALRVQLRWSLCCSHRWQMHFHLKVVCYLSGGQLKTEFFLGKVVEDCAFTVLVGTGCENRTQGSRERAVCSLGTDLQQYKAQLTALCCGQTSKSFISRDLCPRWHTVGDTILTSCEVRPAKPNMTGLLKSSFSVYRVMYRCCLDVFVMCSVFSLVPDESFYFL